MGNQPKNRLMIVAAVSAVSFLGCGSEAPKIKAPQKITSQDGSLADPSDTPSTQPQIDPETIQDAMEGKLLEASYEINVKILGLGMCKGEIELEVDPLMGQGGKMFEMPKACLNCMGIKVDLALAMGTMTGGGTATPAAAALDLDVEDGVISVKEIGPMKASPSRPMFPSFLASSPEELRKLNVSRQVRLQNSQTGESGSGNISIRTLSFDKPYTSPASGKLFKKTMSVETSITGFESISKKMQSMLFEKMEMTVSMEPLALPHLGVELRVEDIMGAGSEAGFDPSQFESPICGESSQFMKFIVQQQQSGGGGILGGLGGALGGGGGGSGIGGQLLKGLMQELIKKSKVEVDLNLIKMEGLK